MSKRYNILICPLEWGLGHAGRMIPLAAHLKQAGNNVFIGAGEEHQSLFRHELPGLSYIDFRGFRPRYSKYLPQYIILFLQAPLLLWHIIREHIRLGSIIGEHKIEIVISDNRFGLWNRKLRTVYVTHQVLIPFPSWLKIFERPFAAVHRYIIGKYTLCFIPDLPGEINVSGRLTHGIKLPPNVRFIGLLSRFRDMMPAAGSPGDDFPHNTVILSGPEPQRSELKNRLARLLESEEVPTIVLEGKPGAPAEVTRSGNLIYYNHMTSPQMASILKGSTLVISRSGYSVIMELTSLGCPALLIPTPGQTEQEYLASYLREKGWFDTVKQKDLDAGLSLRIKEKPDTEYLAGESRLLLKGAIEELLGE